MYNNGNSYPQAASGKSSSRPPYQQQWKKKQQNHNQPAGNDNFSSNNYNNKNQFHSSGGGRMNSASNNCNSHPLRSDSGANASAANYQTSNKNKKSFSVLYTHQKTKKKKTWHDGRLIFSSQNSTRGSLYDASGNIGLMNPTVLDTIELTYNQCQSVVNGTLVDLESEKYLIQVEGVWKENHDASAATTTIATAAARNNNTLHKKPGMQKLLTNKFRMPSKIIPIHPEERRKRQWMEQQQGGGNNGNKRRVRPLQPGELERQYYGDACSAGGGGWNHGNNHDDRGGYYNNNSHGGNNTNAGHQFTQNDSNSGNERRNVDQSYGNNTNSSNNYSTSSAQYNNNHHGRSNHRPTQYNNEYGRNQPPVQQSRHDVRQYNEPQNSVNQVGGNNNQRGGSNSFRSNNNRNRFRSSNGYDPNGFYAEEDDEQHDRNGNNRVGGGDYPNQNGPEDHNTRHESASSVGIHDNTNQTSHIQSQGDQDTNNSTPKDDHDEQVTNHLLALLGAAPPSANNEIVPLPSKSTLPEDHETNNDGNGNHNNGDNSFLASIRQAGANEDQQQQDHDNGGDGPVGFDWAANSDYDDDEEDDDTYDRHDQGGNNENSFLNDLVGIGSKQPQPHVPATTAVPKESISGFTLPSAGESSSSDEDSDDE